MNFTLTPTNLSIPGNYSIIVSANDTAGNIVTKAENLTVNDIAVPNVTLINPGQTNKEKNSEPLAILKERYASGKITKKRYEEMKKDIEE